MSTKTRQNLQEEEGGSLLQDLCSGAPFPLFRGIYKGIPAKRDSLNRPIAWQVSRLLDPRDPGKWYVGPRDGAPENGGFAKVGMIHGLAPEDRSWGRRFRITWAPGMTPAYAQDVQTAIRMIASNS